MKAYLALSAAFAFAACSPSADSETEAPAEAAVEETATVADAGVAAGDYTVDYGDRTGPFSIDADGNWTSTDEDGNEVTGTSAVVDGKICFTNDGEEESECWTNDPAAEDGSFSSTSDTGETVTVTPSGGA
ncbi:MAG: hypothetical protein HKO08_02530 [Erythrobacter sp.]|nr:hypothetical protein [Erythrobacter sp.]